MRRFRPVGYGWKADIATGSWPYDKAPCGALYLSSLRRRRSELAKEQRVAAYVVFADKTLIDMARRKPATAAEVSAVHGVGTAKLRQYGEVFLDVIRQHAAGRP